MLIAPRPVVDDSHLPDSLHPRIRQIYAARGVTQAEALELSARGLAHYQRLHNIDNAVSLLGDTFVNGQKLMIIGDFDADGATSVALCILAIRAMGHDEVDFLVPNRFDFGYGLSPEIVDVAHAQGAQVILTVDNGISCVAGVERANALGIQVIITDHHLAPEQLPAAAAIVNPNQPGCDFPSKHLAGVGVAFYVLLALRSELRARDWFRSRGLDEPNLAEFLDIVAVGTVADVVRLDDNNRILVHQGIQRIRSGRCRPGILALVEAAGRDPARLVASDLGFVVGPRLNAAGRLDDMTTGIQCLLAKDPISARHLAVQLDGLNRERREIEAGMQQQAVAALERLKVGNGPDNGESGQASGIPTGIVLYQPQWHQGVIGIVAGRIKEKYFRPTIAFANEDEDNIKGSARSIPGLHIRDLLEAINAENPGLIHKFGGHAMAAGLSLSLDRLDEFKAAFDATAKAWLAEHSLENQVLSDGSLGSAELSLDFAELLRRHGPWGQGFEEPIFHGEFELMEQRLVGEKHLKMMLRHPDGVLVDAIAFNVDLGLWPNRGISRVMLAYKLDINIYRNRQSLQLLVEGLQGLG